MNYIQANTGGRLHPAGEASVTPLNRGYLYGDAVYEVWRTHQGVLWRWSEHWERLHASARALHLDLPWPAEVIADEIRRTARAYRAATGSEDELYVRLQVTRGAGAIGLDVALADRPDFVILVQPCPEPSPGVRARGLRVTIARDLRRNPVAALDPAWKTGNYLNNVLGLREARARGADEVLFLNLAGEITEASTSNVAFIAGGRLITPALSCGLLAGVTRGVLLREIAPAAGLRVEERAVRPEELGEFTEAMVLSTIRDLLPVASIDAFAFTAGAGPVTARLQEAWAAAVRAHAGAYPEWRL